jgi:toxin ParE1/3/4
MQPIDIRASARQDITNHYVYLAEHAGLAVAESFLTNAEPSFSDLAERPAMATILRTRTPDITGIRKWRVKGFEAF